VSKIELQEWSARAKVRVDEDERSHKKFTIHDYVSVILEAFSGIGSVIKFKKVGLIITFD
jgi:hypothetical protein